MCTERKTVKTEKVTGGALFSNILGVQNFLINAGFYASCIFVCYLTFAIPLDVILRYFGISFFVGVVELSEYALLAIALLCAPWVYKKDCNLKVDILLTNRSRGFKISHARAVNILILILSIIVLYYSSISLIDSINRNRYVFKMLSFPEWYINWIIPFSMLLIATESLIRIFTRKHSED